MDMVVLDCDGESNVHCVLRMAIVVQEESLDDTCQGNINLNDIISFVLEYHLQSSSDSSFDSLLNKRGPLSS
jgi:hypothetical protein